MRYLCIYYVRIVCTYVEEFLVAGDVVSGIPGHQTCGQWDFWWPETWPVGFLVARNVVSGISVGQKCSQWDFWSPEMWSVGSQVA
jgi:hypothetical protein